jgi:hypothetical protein
MRTILACLLAILPLALGGGCETDVAAGNARQSEVLKFRGAVVFVELEGAFYGILGDHGAKYEPINLPADFQVGGLRVCVAAVEEPDMASVHMWGKMIRILAISRESDMPFNQ